MKTVPMETATASSLALVTGASAAMALPPQMAVPAEMRKPEVFADAEQPGEAKRRGAWRR